MKKLLLLLIMLCVLCVGTVGFASAEETPVTTGEITEEPPVATGEITEETSVTVPEQTEEKSYEEIATEIAESILSQYLPEYQPLTCISFVPLQECSMLFQYRYIAHFQCLQIIRKSFIGFQIF